MSAGNPGITPIPICRYPEPRATDCHSRRAVASTGYQAMQRRFPLLLLLLLGPAVAFGEQQQDDSDVVFPQRLNARDLLYACNSSAITHVGRERRRYCAGFISGVEEAARLLQARHGDGGRARICLPLDVSSRRLADIYTRYAARHESILEQPAAEVAFEALASAFPCEGNGQP